MSVDFLSAFKFNKKHNTIYNLDPRTKIFILLIYSILSLIFQNFFILVTLFLTLVIFFALARDLKKLIAYNKSLTFMIFFIFFINIFYFNIDFALAMIFRLLIMMDSFLLFFATIHPDELSQSLYKMKIPFQYAFSISLAARFVPSLTSEARNIRDAQMSRGIDFQKGSLFYKIRKYIPLLIPLYISAIRKAHFVAESMESRGFNQKIKRSFLYELNMKVLDYFLIILFSIIMFLGLYFTFFLSSIIPTITQLIQLMI
ncbi:MAG: energy-coupling factor transporter transmembrane protein EcfT [Candidatus Lokiarchaeota archaeon]|nr:energy-coupling factor transporter transmembrane protein EcfT [Candidatus Lokiarchaeota archaeon]